MNSLLISKSRVFERADPHAVSEFVNRHVGAHCIRLPRKGNPQASLSHRKFGELDLCRLSYGGSVHVTSPALETIFHLQLLQRGHCLWLGKRGEQHHFTPGEVLLINPDDPVNLTYSDDCEKFIIKLPVSFLEKVCSDNQWQAPVQGIRFLSSRHSLQRLEGFDSLLGLICLEAEAEQSVPQVREQYGRIIAGKLLSLLDNNVTREPLTEGCAPFERIAEYIEVHLKQDITVAQLAALAHMSPRSLYLLFERHTGRTPMAYIRQKKLQRIRDCLSNPAARVRNITEIAMEYGFLHLGRFSENYRNAFGELPSDTLRRHY